MKVVFFGTPTYAEITLNYLIDQGVDIVAIVTRPDKPKGRSKKLQAPPVKVLAEQRLPSVPIYQPTKASTPEFCETLKAHGADIFVVVAYGEIIKQMLLDLPPLGCINVHFSLLPKWRGAAPMQHSLLNGDTESGVTIIEMVLAMDAGDILGVQKIPVPTDMTCGELATKLCEIAPPLLLKVMHELKEGIAKPIPQEENLITMAPKITKETSEIDWQRSAKEIHNQIRALSPKPGAFTFTRDEKRLKILRSRLSDQPTAYGKTGWFRACGEGSIEILEVQIEGKSAMPVKNFIAGNPNIEIA